MSTIDTAEETKKETQLDSGTYEILRKRLGSQAEELQSRLNKLNSARKEIFGALDARLLATDRISTDNNCVPRDMVPVLENLFIFGYNVHIGLKKEAALSDVFSVYAYNSTDHSFHPKDLNILHDKTFEKEFKELYQYYRDTVFVKFFVKDNFLYMIFRVGKNVTDIKAFKWLIEENGLKYIDNRSDHEVQYPRQHEFEWKRASRDDHRTGEHPHVSIMDRVFVETVGGDLTIKIEDNTSTGEGIYAEEVEIADQTLDDAEIYYADLGNLILLKMRPFQEKKWRFIVFNDKIKEARRIDAIEDSCVLLPDDQGIIVSNGYYLQTGEYKHFDSELTGLKFERRIHSPNGEDTMYVFYQRELGEYILLSYNVIEKQVESPIACHGYSFFKSGELVYFKTDDEPKKIHGLQVWQTPYVHPDFVQAPAHADSFLYKVGNKDIVRAMSDCYAVLNLCRKEDSYEGLYADLSRSAMAVTDNYYWVGNEEAFELSDTLSEIRLTASTAIEEFEKVARQRKHAAEQTKLISEKADELLKEVDRRIFQHVDEFVRFLAELRTVRGEVISLKEVRYVDLSLVDHYETALAEKSDKLSAKCVEFLLRDDALLPYVEKVEAVQEEAEAVEKVTVADEVAEGIAKIGSELELLIDIVSNLKIEDATQTTQIIDLISDIYARLNNVKAKLKARRKELLGAEAIAEFNAQLKLINQAVVNYLDVSDTPQKCEEYLTKLMVQMEELEGKFSDFDEFLGELTAKRDEIYSAFETRKTQLQEERNKRAMSVQSAAERILKGIRNKLKSIKEINEINSYFASDLMVDKVRDMIKKLHEIEDAPKAEDLQSQLKTLKEDAVRQLKDRQDLFVGGDNVIKMGRHHFAVNTQELDASLVLKDDGFFYHLAGTQFYEKVINEQLEQTREVWQQSVISENKTVYRGEYLAYQLFRAIENGAANTTFNEFQEKDDTERLEVVQAFMASRYHEGYTKGVHDKDALLILEALVLMRMNIGLLRYSPDARATAALFWSEGMEKADKQQLENRIKGMSLILQVFPDSKEYQSLIEDLEEDMTVFAKSLTSALQSTAKEAAAYLFHELATDTDFIASKEATQLCKQFLQHIEMKRVQRDYEETKRKLKETDLLHRLEWELGWLNAFASTLPEEEQTVYADYLSEAAVILLLDDLNSRKVSQLSVKQELKGLAGDHAVITQSQYQFDYNALMEKLQSFEAIQVPKFEAFINLKKEIAADFKAKVKLDSFKPRVLSSFVRNKLIDDVYLPLVGDNLAKQMGTVGENKRTDLMGLLLLVSPPGYGKTTLMEYIASRLGLIFMKINGPAIGHQVTSLDPSEAPNATAREELEKLNLSFEMGDNVMIYLDDIQHCHPELLQKFISLCDGQRKIEGVYKGVTKTYDFRGKKVCVVMAGNPYTESGDKFQIPDMLANRADTYNLGEIIGDSAEAFKLSYIENSLTSNPVLNKLTSKSKKDIYTLINIAKTGNREGAEFESNISGEEVNEFVSVLEKMLKVQEVVLQVNQQYVRSAAQEDAYRTEPPFKMQGSYRNMNKLAEKIVPIMNTQELDTLILSHYEGESQTLTTGAEANMLKFKSLVGWQSNEENQRWDVICQTFKKNNQLKGFGDNNQMAQVLAQMSAFTDGLEAIKKALENGLKN
ncbi:DNA repair ATPase [Limibacter armeniacum]|uniref:DNA repair ATPase n=1 Tax=Limibacter armeniacum TaxID=466084 RepID=UPI002FE607DE